MAQRVNEIKEQLSKALYDETKPWTPILVTLEDKTGIPRLYIFIGTVIFTGLWLAFCYAAELVCNSVGFLYPAYGSMLALESPGKEDDRKWLTYWVVFAVFSIIEYFADIIVGWFPLYWLVKCIFLIWLMLPIESNGANILYKDILRPYFLQNFMPAGVDSKARGEKEN